MAQQQQAPSQHNGSAEIKDAAVIEVPGDTKNPQNEQQQDAKQQQPGGGCCSCGGHRGGGGSGRLARAASSYWSNVRARPLFMLLPPLLTFALLCSLSVAGVVLGADKLEHEARDRAESAAMDWAASFKLSTEKIFTPLVALSLLIQQAPEVAGVEAMLPGVAKQLLNSINKGENRTVVQELQVSPMGVIEAIYPNTSDTRSRLGINIFQQPKLRSGALNTIKERDVVLNGPLEIVSGGFGTIARIPIFIQNASRAETFGTNRSEPDDCPPGLCYNATSREKFYGFATAIGPLDDLRAGNDSRLDLLKQKHYQWLMTRPYTASERNDSKLYSPLLTDARDDYIFAASARRPDQRSAVTKDIDIGNAVWRVFLAPEGGWRPAWERGVIAAAVLGCALMAALVGIIMAFWAQQGRLLGDVLESNRRLEQTTGKLQEEKLRLDALLVRQYNLIAVLGKGSPQGGRSQAGGGGGSGSCESGDGTGSPESSATKGLTLDRIESMRRQLSVNSNTSAQDMESIQTIELLGEGTFGKVYRGLWRGSVVAVKTLLLPANMSGAEKREKMAVMEAAISSSLSHPNIVQTYTYAIRPMRDSPSSTSQVPQQSPPSSDPTPPPTRDLASTLATETGGDTAGLVHSYEVRLVLEFCDRGCLRNALDDGVFIMDSGALNFLAILDTAADVAKAMLHLHSLNVLHSDLKARNVMLSSGSRDGRGVVGKVGDFGLSLKMDHNETHISQIYQGTMSHAPEILLEGRVSKAADVYAFGITLWEMYSGGRVFEGVPRALLGHQITKEHLRPRFPLGTPAQFCDLAQRCWQAEWQLRPTFVEILQELQAMRGEDPSPTPPLNVVLHTGSHLTSSSGGGTRSGGGAGAAAASAAAAAALATVSDSGGGTGGAGNGSTSVPLIIIGSRATNENELSYYLDHSADSDWSRGASGCSNSMPSLISRSGLMRPRMPQIAESSDEAAAAEQQLAELEAQQEQQQQRRRQRAGSSGASAPDAAARAGGGSSSGDGSSPLPGSSSAGSRGQGA